ncbi:MULTISPECIES: hypothetical protein [Leuconostoc gelidum group]|uniref:hypothetical protein n=1 Tax=Leuconostoc gelidum group TaxID=3016637 RepID=UPI00027E6C57|nr:MULTISPECIES: hypothetical protein [Leuconostoc gelidum group]AFS40250.1 hypothetical protein C269_04035 [Leuconostoc gelidum JB7]MBZ5948029.1 hypothetical protein [Leuconostoc gasicomitatum]MBZ5988180.1 hypothetical protein [Leuconostoc gasicomitatum]MBZ5990153.1 hypothetical protein [Leuconostoc gasicomitatum]
MEILNTTLSVIASILAIASTIWGASNQHQINKINKNIENSNNKLLAMGNNNTQQNGNHNQVNNK